VSQEPALALAGEIELSTGTVGPDEVVIGVHTNPDGHVAGTGDALIGVQMNPVGHTTAAELTEVDTVGAVVIVEVFGRGRHVGAVHALLLQPQHHHDIGAGEPFAHVTRDLDAHPLDADRQ